MNRHFSTLFESHKQEYIIQREGSESFKAFGMANREESTNRKYVGFPPESSIQAGDKLTNSVNESVYVSEVETTFYRGEPFQKKAFVVNESEYFSKKSMPNAVFNIHNAYGSIIGNQPSAILNYSGSFDQLRESISTSDSVDKDELNELLDILKLVMDEKIPAKKGILSKFSEVMERNSWITGSIASSILSWLLTSIG